MNQKANWITRQTWMTWLAMALMASQFIFKLVIEIRMASETANAGVIGMAWIFTAGWPVWIGLALAGKRLGYWMGAIWGLMHFVLTVPLSLTGVCDHYALATVVVSHGLLITAACLLVLLRTPGQSGHTLFWRSLHRGQVVIFGLLGLSTLTRLVWITFRETAGAARALAAFQGKGGFAATVAGSLQYVVTPSMFALCVIVPGIMMRQRWAFILAAAFGSLHVVLTTLNVFLGVNQGFGPAIVIPASLGMVICSLIWLQMDVSAPIKEPK